LYTIDFMKSGLNLSSRCRVHSDVLSVLYFFVFDLVLFKNFSVFVFFMCLICFFNLVLFLGCFFWSN
jgi:hypothetical protein